MGNFTGTNSFDFIDTDPMRIMDSDDTVDAKGGNDFIITRGGNDEVDLGAGHDTAFLGEGDDVAYGADGDDLVYGDNGSDTLYGENGDDELHGGAGEDQLYGEEGDDYLDGGAGSDESYGGNGDDTLVYDSTDSVINGGAGRDTVFADGSNVDVSSPLVDVEVIDLTDGVANTFDYMGLDIYEEDIEDITDANNTLRVEGEAGDTINIDDSGWLNSGFQNVGVNADGYSVWIGQSSNTGDVVTLEIDPAILVV